MSQKLPYERFWESANFLQAWKINWQTLSNFEKLRAVYTTPGLSSLNLPTEVIDALAKPAEEREEPEFPTTAEGRRAKSDLRTAVSHFVENFKRRDPSLLRSATASEKSHWEHGTLSGILNFLDAQANLEVSPAIILRKQEELEAYRQTPDQSSAQFLELFALKADELASLRSSAIPEKELITRALRNLDQNRNRFAIKELLNALTFPQRFAKGPAEADNCLNNWNQFVKFVVLFENQSETIAEQPSGPDKPQANVAQASSRQSDTGKTVAQARTHKKGKSKRGKDKSNRGAAKADQSKKNKNGKQGQQGSQRVDWGSIVCDHCSNNPDIERRFTHHNTSHCPVQALIDKSGKQAVSRASSQQDDRTSKRQRSNQGQACLAVANDDDVFDDDL